MFYEKETKESSNVKMKNADFDLKYRMSAYGDNNIKSSDNKQVWPSGSNSLIERSLKRYKMNKVKAQVFEGRNVRSQAVLSTEASGKEKFRDAKNLSRKRGSGAVGDNIYFVSINPV